jgi:deoxyribose-phosphate aldolase
MTDLAALIDHTILGPDATTAQVLEFCEQARAFRFHSVCVNPVHVRLVAEALAGSAAATCAVVGFPLGANTPDIKAAEAARARSDGAAEIDMVIALGALKDGRTDLVERDIACVRAACPGATLKTIIETCLLTDDEKRLACRIAQNAGADYVKTSTGFSRHGATTADIALMRQTVGAAMGVKASGGIRTREAAEAMVAAGATRIGTSSGLLIIGQAKAMAETY